MERHAPNTRHPLRCYVCNSGAGIGNDDAAVCRCNKQTNMNGGVPDAIMSHIIIIEKDQLMRGLLAEWLSDEGYRVSTRDGSRATMAGTPDLVIVDVYMPRHIGGTKMRALQSAFAGVPIIAISGQFRPGLAAAGSAARALGVHQVIAKPFCRDELVRAVRATIGPPD